MGLLLCVFLRRVGKLNGDYQSRSQLSLSSSLRNNPLYKLNSFEDEVVVDYECRFRRNRPWTDHIFCIRRILDIFALLGCYATLFSSYWRFRTTCRSHFHESSGPTAGPLEIGLRSCPDTSVTNYQSTMRNIPEERISHLHRGWSLKSRQIIVRYEMVIHWGSSTAIYRLQESLWFG